MSLPKHLDLATLAALYESAALTPMSLAREILARCARATDPAIWISRVSDADLLADAARLEALGPAPERPLWGIPFAVKDNIDCAGLATTAGCPQFAYTPDQDAPVVARLKSAGALLVGKTNLDQFATGLNGTRSPYGAPRSVFNADYISGGSSSGSAVAVAAGLVSFALGTDTAGSGRVPAAFNHLIGIKPSPGRLSSRGVVPACRSLDCVSVFALSVADGDAVRRQAEGFDPADGFSRSAGVRRLPLQAPRIGVLATKDREFFGDAEAAKLYDGAIAAARALGWSLVEIDYAPFAAAAELLYGGPWLAERWAAIGSFLEANPAAVHPAVRKIVEGGRNFSAADAFRGRYRLADLVRQAETEWAQADALLLPTSPTIYTVEQMLATPVELNARLGRYTNFVNLMGCAAVAVPAGFRADGLPLGVTLVAPGDSDDDLAVLADRLHRSLAGNAPGPALAARPASGDLVIGVVGAHLSGQPLNPQLTEAGGKLLAVSRTAADYRFYLLPNTTPAKPGLVRQPGFAGPGIEIEEWSLPAAEFGRFVAAIPAPLGVGKVTLADGRQVTGFLAEPHALEGAPEITRHGGWRGWLAAAR